MKTKLNMGCGSRKLLNHHNVDLLPLFQPDEVVDLENIPWPWPDNSFDTITANHVIEHLGPVPRHFLEILKEMYRVSRPNATWEIVVPHWRCDTALDDPTHVRMITQSTFALFDQQKNVEDIKQNSPTSALGVGYRIDLAVIDTRYDVIPMWQDKIKTGEIGRQEFERNMNHWNNVCVETQMRVRVHKPERQKHWIETFLAIPQHVKQSKKQ